MIKIKVKTSNLFFIIILFIIIVITTAREIKLPAEEIDLPAGIGLDLTKDQDGELVLSIPMSIYNFSSGKDEKLSSNIHIGIGKTIGETRNNRSVKSNQKYVFGSEKIYIFSEEFAKSIFRVPIDSLFRNTEVNDLGYVVVCKGDSLPILQFKIEGYPSSSDYIGGMIENSKLGNFFADEYKLIDIFLKIDAEGKNVVLPYLELKEEGLEITGMALFKKDKMIRKIDLNDAKIMNMLRNDNLVGTLNIKKNLNQYSDMFVKSKRKIKCFEENGKYNFLIDLDISGELYTNGLYKDLTSDLDVKKKYEYDMSMEVQRMCDEFIKKMQQEYSLDCLELGQIAAGKYGRNTGTDWDKIISDSNIKVNVKVTLTKFGRGSY